MLISHQKKGRRLFASTSVGRIVFRISFIGGFLFAAFMQLGKNLAELVGDWQPQMLSLHWKD